MDKLLNIKKAHYRVSLNGLRGMGLCLEFRREERHGAALGADVGRDGYGFLMRLADGLAEEELGNESSSEAISGTDGVSHLHFGRSDIVLFGIREDIRADGTTGKDEHIQLVTRDEFAADTAGLLRVLGDEFAGNGRFAKKHGSYNIEFLIVDLEDIRPLERFSDHFGGVPRLTEVDVKDLECNDFNE